MGKKVRQCSLKIETQTKGERTTPFTLRLWPIQAGLFSLRHQIYLSAGIQQRLVSSRHGPGKTNSTNTIRDRVSQLCQALPGSKSPLSTLSKSLWKIESFITQRYNSKRKWPFDSRRRLIISSWRKTQAALFRLFLSSIAFSHLCLSCCLLLCTFSL